MSNPFIEKEVDKIIKEQKFQFPVNLAMASAWIIANFKGMNIKVFDVANTSSLADYYIIGSTQNSTQSRAIVDEVLFNLKRHDSRAISIEGIESGEWILVDMGDIIVHLFEEYSREIYDLDRLWSEHEQVTIPTEYYMNTTEVEAASKGDSSGYF